MYVYGSGQVWWNNTVGGREQRYVRADLVEAARVTEGARYVQGCPLDERCALERGHAGDCFPVPLPLPACPHAEHRQRKLLRTETIVRVDADGIAGHYEVCWCEVCGAVKQGDGPWTMPLHPGIVCRVDAQTVEHWYDGHAHAYTNTSVYEDVVAERDRLRAEVGNLNLKLAGAIEVGR